MKKYKGYLTKNPSARATFKDDEQFSIFEDGGNNYWTNRWNNKSNKNNGITI